MIASSIVFRVKVQKIGEKIEALYQKEPLRGHNANRFKVKFIY